MGFRMKKNNRGRNCQRCRILFSPFFANKLVLPLECRTTPPGSHSRKQISSILYQCWSEAHATQFRAKQALLMKVRWKCTTGNGTKWQTQIIVCIDLQMNFVDMLNIKLSYIWFCLCQPSTYIPNQFFRFIATTIQFIYASHKLILYQFITN